MNVFEGTAGYYGRYRPGLPPEVIALLADAGSASRPRRLLDIGTGTGLVVKALLDQFDDIIALDTDADMLAIAETDLRWRLPHGARLSLCRGAAEEFMPPPGWRADLVTLCRVFHWLDRPAVLARLNQHVAPHGAVAVLADRSLWTATNPWQQAVRSVVQDFLGTQRRAGSGAFPASPEPFGQTLRSSAFSNVTETYVPVRRTWSTDGVLGYLYSTSFAAPHLFGDRRDRFEAAVKQILAPFSDNDTFIEDNTFVIHLGRRPA
ncbi:class I SAM-dependent methyltransferase [Streptomyces sp. H10-C2]|uniref:class I SAM-dependent methyltransferase n=1 Tax=unclassified Streptomyces TaxID=2593676 RepID=UPI0024B8EA9E|nr:MULTISPECIES: class I SAM-dependent methyltransferase [unclassified Streptomyces]MDJ0344939.1 class I SAM-dependent methyltransferase [Streptomyces sp. PH10-H1]MDJ0373803.1 class I SAM-dependent methyltransferase [Streptomyces sp. H10-C2]